MVMRVRAQRTAWLAVVLALLAGLLTTTTANAEVHHPRQKWLREATAGLFLHWGMFTAPRHTDCAAWERAVTDGGWSADYWVDEARKLGASYIVLATFHSRLGYARPWPSKVPGSCATQRDLLGELVKAGNAKGVRTILYMTDDPQWHKETGVESLDSAAYSAYKGKQVDLTTRPGFGEYSYDLFHEVMDRYSDLAGFWIDNDNEYWEKNKLYEQIREKRPSWLLSNNNEDTPIMDTVSNEQKTGITPSYDYPQAAFTPMPRLTEADYKLPTNGGWWYDGTDQAVDFRLSTGRYITNAGSSMKSLMAETPMVNGKFPPQQEAYNNFMASWVPPIKSSLQGKEGGGYMYGGMQPGFWNDGAHGVITVEPDARTQYLHVVTRPRTDLLRLRDNGYKVTKVSDLRSGAPLRFSQSGGYLTIVDIKGWDIYDTVFKVETAGQQYFHDSRTIKATASSSRAGHPASNLVDGNFENYWDADGKQPVSLTLDLGKRRTATYLAVNQREMSPTHARESFGRPEDSSRIQDYRVYVSDDGRNWGKPVRTGAMPSARGVQFVELGEQHTRFVKLEVLNTWSGPQAKPFYRQLAIDEIKVAYGYPSSFPGTQVPLEAESFRNDHDGRAHLGRCASCSGSFQVTGLGGGPRNAVSFPEVTVAEAGTYRLQLDTTSGSATSVSVSVNGGAPVETAIDANTPGIVASTAMPVPLKAGANTVKVFSGAATGPGLDRIAVAPLPPESYTPKTTLTVEPGGVQWLSPGRQSMKVTAKLRLDADDAIGRVTMAPVVPAGWTLRGAPATAASMRVGQELEASWTLDSPEGVTTADIPVTATFDLLGRAKAVSKPVRVSPRPSDRVFMREAEDSANDVGSAGVTNCGVCSGGQKVRNIGGDPSAFVLFENVTVAEARRYTLYIDFTVNGPRSYFVTVNGGTPVEVKVDGAGNNTQYTTSVPVELRAGANTIKLHNDHASAPDLDRLSLG
ncbi:alpha-L-fucosidase [Amycolatopsis orientalis]|uniref:alpha-L-fucosidase n=1 Tax=Amycolatopsis orientalis TaxID=31958 RepID=A0A193C2H3_AMYOR|nr:CBM35 domain-containing protein [Amycolatopsis orientalis]ANN18598.1 alpha-L-fucosidase [Amycolatopsis orientalis]